MSQNKTTMSKSFTIKLSKVSSSSSSPSNSELNCRNRLSKCCAQRLLAQNHTNFKRSAKPDRLMYYDGGSWVDFPTNVINSLRCAFEKKEVEFELIISGKKYIFDYLRMVLVDLESGKLQSIAWIDKKSKCFFPKTFITDDSTDDESTDDEPESSE